MRTGLVGALVAALGCSSVTVERQATNEGGAGGSAPTPMGGFSNGGSDPEGGGGQGGAGGVPMDILGCGDPDIFYEVYGLSAGPSFEAMRGDLWGSGPDDIWIVGQGETAWYHFAGDAWSTTGPAFEGFAAIAMSGAGPDQAFVASTDGQVARYDGDTWTIEANIMPTTDLFVDVDGNAMAIGDGQFVLRQGGVWGAPQPVGSIERMHGTSMSDIFAVGPGGLALYYNGAGWSVIPTGTTADLHAVWVDGPATAWAVGDDGTVLRLSPSGAEPLEVPEYLDNHAFYSVSKAPGGPLFVMSGGFVIGWLDGTWYMHDLNFFDGGMHVMAFSPNDVVVAGAQHAILHCRLD